MVRDETILPFEGYFWQGVDLDGKVVLDAGTGFGLTTCEIAKRISKQKHKGKIVSVDIDSESFKLARKQLLTEGLMSLADLRRLVSFVRADLSHMPEVTSNSIDVIVSTRTVADINSHPCRLVRAIAEFHRVLKPNGQIVLSDECPLLRTQNQEQQVAVMRWQLVKAVSHLIGTPHANEVEPEDLESITELVGFRKCRWVIFRGDRITQQRINHFVSRASESARLIDNQKLADAFLEEIQHVKSLFNEQAGIFPPHYILHAKK